MRAGSAPHQFVLLSDHGGHDRTHGTDSPVDVTIPWIASGPGIVHGRIDTEVRIFDTGPTVAKLLGLTPAPQWEGTAVPEVFAASSGPGVPSEP